MADGVGRVEESSGVIHLFLLPLFAILDDFDEGCVVEAIVVQT